MRIPLRDMPFSRFGSYTCFSLLRGEVFGKNGLTNHGH